MPLKLRVQPELDDRSLSDVQDKARSVFDALGPELGAGMSRGLTSELDKIGPSFVHLGTLAQGAMSDISVGAVAAAAGLAGIALAGERAAEALYGVGERFDAISDSMAARTGKMGSDLDALATSFSNVAGNTAASLEDIGDVLSRVSQSLHLTGAPLEQVTKQIADLNAMTGDALNIRDLGRVLAGFGEDAGNAAPRLDELYVASARTGIPINNLTSIMITAGPAARTLGLEFSDLASLITKFEEAGIPAERTAMALTRAAGVFADANIPLQTGLQDTITQIRGFIDVGNEAAAVDLAGKVFGTRGAQQFVDLIRQGKLSADGLHDTLRNTDDAIERMRSATGDWAETWDLVKNRVSLVAEEIGGPLFNALNSALRLIFNPMPPEGPSGPSGAPPAGYNPTNPLDVFAPGGPAPQLNAGPGQPLQPGLPYTDMMAPPGIGGQLGNVPRTPQDINQAIEDSKKKSGGGGTPKAAPVPYPPGYTGSPVERAQHDVAQAQADLAAAQASGDPNAITTANNRLVDANNNLRKALQGEPASGSAVQVPFPPGLGAPPAPGESASQYSAEQSYWSAVGRRQTAEANVAALQASGTATPSDMVKAENDLTKARGDENAALLRLQETTAKTNDSLSSTADQLGDIGVKLDQDFGISKGLPGIAENLTRFLASLAFAPVEGAMRGAQAGLGYPGGQGSGSGLAGMIGSAVLGPGQPSGGGGGGGAQFPFGGFPGGSFPGGYPSGSSGLPITYPGGSPYPASGQPSGNRGGGGAPAAFGPNAVANLIYNMARSRGYSQSEAVSIVAYSIGESGLNPGISGGVQGDAEVLGLFQEKPGFAISGGIDPSQRGNAYYNTLAYLNQLDRHPGRNIYDRLLATSVGGPLYTGGPGVMPGLEARARQYLGFAQGGGVDTVPAMLQPGEHVLTTKDVAAMGGQQGVYAFRDALQSGTQHMPPGATPGVPIPPGPVATPGGPIPLPPGVKPGAPPGQQGPTSIGGISPPAGIRAGVPDHRRRSHRAAGIATGYRGQFGYCRGCGGGA